MKLFFLTFLAFIVACNMKNDSNATSDIKNAPAKDTLHYAYTAMYSSDITSPSHSENAQRVLTVWKLFESNLIDSMKPYWADSVVYHDASGLNFHGPSDQLLAIAKQDIAGLDSLRFDLITWQSEHVNDKDEDWVRIWARERRYAKHVKPDTTLIQENWQVKNGRVIYFDQYKAALPK